MAKQMFTRENLESVMKALAAHFGKDCEIALHDFTHGFDHSLVSIENGHVTSRTAGSSITNAGLEALAGDQSSIGNGLYNYFSTTEDGRVIRSSTAILRDEAGGIVGSLCINQDISQYLLAENALKSITLSSERSPDLGEVFVNDVSELLEHYIRQCLDRIGKPPGMMTKEDQLQAIQYLEDRGVFSITKAGPKVCEAFNITKYLLYRLLDTVRSTQRDLSRDA